MSAERLLRGFVRFNSSCVCGGLSYYTPAHAHLIYKFTSEEMSPHGDSVCLMYTKPRGSSLVLHKPRHCGPWCKEVEAGGSKIQGSGKTAWDPEKLFPKDINTKLRAVAKFEGATGSPNIHC